MLGLPHRSPHHVHQQPRGYRHAPQTARPTKAYNPHHPERTVLYETVAEHFETWIKLASAGQFDEQGVDARLQGRGWWGLHDDKGKPVPSIDLTRFGHQSQSWGKPRWVTGWP